MAKLRGNVRTENGPKKIRSKGRSRDGTKKIVHGTARMTKAKLAVLCNELRCNEITPNKQRCSQFACVNQKKCVKHGGYPGYESILGSKSLGQAFVQARTIHNPLSLENELALQRTMLMAVLEKMKGQTLANLTPTMIAPIMSITKEIGAIISIMAKVQQTFADSVHVEDIMMVVDSIVQILIDNGIGGEQLDRIAEAMQNEVCVPIQPVDVELI